jgi:hypothetical protein
VIGTPTRSTVEAALATALERASAAADCQTVRALAGELEARRKARGAPGIVDLERSVAGELGAGNRQIGCGLAVVLSPQSRGLARCWPAAVSVVTVTQMSPRRGDDLTELARRARGAYVSPAQHEAQRRSFAYGNAVIENPRVTREVVDAQAERVRSRFDRR